MPLPEQLRPLFWDVDVSQISWEANEAFVMGRVLAEGTWDDLLWLRRTAGDTAIREHLVASRARALSPQKTRLWEVLLGLPHDEVTGWLHSKERAVWDGRAG